MLPKSYDTFSLSLKTEVGGVMTKEKISELIKKRRKELKIKQDDLSEISGVTLHTISDIESGKGNPTV